jgi:hypothetical protein
MDVGVVQTAPIVHREPLPGVVGLSRTFGLYEVVPADKNASHHAKRKREVRRTTLTQTIKTACLNLFQMLEKGHRSNLPDVSMSPTNFVETRMHKDVAQTSSPDVVMKNRRVFTWGSRTQIE